jgi:hypothetical protein
MMKIAAQIETFLVAVERPPWNQDEFITVTDDCDGLGPDVLATYPIERVESPSPQDAAREYAEEHDLLPIHVNINLSNEDGEWVIEENGAHEV